MSRPKKEIMVPFLFSLVYTSLCLLSRNLRLLPGNSFSEKLFHFDRLFAVRLSPITFSDALLAAFLFLIFFLFSDGFDERPKKLRSGSEYGSARWGTPKDLEGFTDPSFRKNMILTRTESLALKDHMKDPRKNRNKNVLILGGSGSGKSRSFVAPNLLQMHSSYVVTDPKSELLLNFGKVLKENGYVLRYFNTIDFKKSFHYNPFAYLKSEKDILSLVTAIIQNTKGDGTAGDDFWVKAEQLLYSALIGYLLYEAVPEDRNFKNLLLLLDNMETREEDETFESSIDLLFKELEEKDPSHFAVRQYKKFKMAAGKTAKSILISCAARLAPFDIAQVREITEYDELSLDSLGDRKSALFLIMSDTDPTFNFLIAICYSQLFNLLCEKADAFGGALKIPVRCLIDECANIGKIPNLERLIATIRSRKISAALVLQAQSQLKAIYKDSAETIIGNCDSRLFLGGTEPGTLKLLSESLGKETIDSESHGKSRSRETSHSVNTSKLGKALMTPDELAILDGNKAILQIRGLPPFLSDKYDVKTHPSYPKTGWADPENLFDPAQFASAPFTAKPEELCEFYEIEI